MLDLHWHSAGTSEPRDEKTDFMGGYSAVIGPMARKPGFAWQVIGPVGQEVTAGEAADSDAAKAAVHAWWVQSVEYSIARTDVAPAGLEETRQRVYVHPADPSRDGEDWRARFEAAAAENHAHGLPHGRRDCGLCFRTCAACGASMPLRALERLNLGGSLACKSAEACMLRQNGQDPVLFLGALLRGMGAELEGLTSRQLAELRYDLRGDYGARWDEGFTGALNGAMGRRGDTGEAIAAVAADRLARKRRRAALQAAATRAARKAATS